LSKLPQKIHEKIKEFAFLQHAAQKPFRCSLQMQVKGLGQIFGERCRVFSIFCNYYDNFHVFGKKTQ